MTLTAPDGTVVTVTGLPARHGPEGSEAVSGDVVGFLLTAPGQPSVYVRGDNAGPVMGAYAEFERSLIRERQRERITLTRQRGAYKGRKKDPHT